VIVGRRTTPAAPTVGTTGTRARRVRRSALLTSSLTPTLTLTLRLTLTLLAVGAWPEGKVAAREVAFLEFPVESVMPRRIGAGDADDGDQLELEINLELASAYVFRGYNVFQAESQREQKWVQRPEIVWSAPGTGFSIGYAAANQVTGDNLVHNVAEGLGAEHDVFSAYEFGRRSRLGLTAEVAVVAYPAAEKKLVGTDTPVFVSISAEPRYRHNLYFFVGYLRGFRHGAFEGDQVYLNPRVEKRFAFGDSFGLELQLGVGMKILQTDLTVVRDNMFDVLASTTLYYALNDVFYVGAKVGWAWTNFSSHVDPDTGQSIASRFADEYVPFWGLSVGAEFSAGPSASASPGARKPTLQAM
jgi:hypothetical protein